MNTSNDLRDPGYPDPNKVRFTQRVNRYEKMIKWLVIVNIIAWSVVAYVVLDWLSA
jgi:hypothetical protein